LCNVTTYTYSVSYGILHFNNMEKTTFGWVDFRMPRVMFASPWDFEVSSFNCILIGYTIVTHNECCGHSVILDTLCCACCVRWSITSIVCLCVCSCRQCCVCGWWGGGSNRGCSTSKNTYVAKHTLGADN